GVVDYCFANYDLIIKTAIKAACGTGYSNSSYYDETYNVPYGGCRHKNTDKICPTGQFITAVNVDPSTPAGVGSIRYTCTDLIAPSFVGAACPYGQSVTGYNPDGTANCSLGFLNCPAGNVLVKTAAGYVCTDVDCMKSPWDVGAPYAFAGFKADGTAECRQINNIRNCGADNFATNISPNETVTCSPAVVVSSTCAPGYRIQGVDAAGNANCQPFITLPFDCGAGNAVVGFDSTGYRICSPVDRPLACDGTRNLHTYNYCTNNGGQIRNYGTPTSQCMFSGATCLAGMTRCNSWGSQIQEQCTDTSTYFCSTMVQTRYATPTSLAFTNYAQTTNQCVYWAGVAGSGNPYSANYHQCQIGGWFPAILSKQTEVGCY
ncbi:MAG: hypothetical protein PHY93_05955, partial [Bacteriovorax sp.]|nr:hypothetical protein [Bacteriovorax sp.]